MVKLCLQSRKLSNLALLKAESRGHPKAQILNRRKAQGRGHPKPKPEGGVFILVFFFFGHCLLWFGCVSGLSAYGLLAFWPWPLDFLQPRGLEHTAFLSWLASWILGFFGSFFTL